MDTEKSERQQNMDNLSGYGTRKAYAAAASLDGSGSEKELMADYAARFNLAYFSGTFRNDDPSWTEDPARALWEKQADSAFWKYMKLVMDEASGDNLRLECAAH